MVNRRNLLQVFASGPFAIGPVHSRSRTRGLNFKSLSGETVVVPSTDLAELRRSVAGPLLLAHDSNYNLQRKTWNRLFDHHPALIVSCRTTTDVCAAVDCARQFQLLTAVRSGGHSFAGLSSCDGGLVIDLSAMNSIDIATESSMAHIEPGAQIGAVDAASMARRLATPCGSCPNVGMGGFVTGGGIGRTSRQFGLSCDNLRSATVVCSDGRQRVVSENQNPDLFWAIRGGGGNFGIVTQMSLRLHPMAPMVLGGRMVWPIKHARDVLSVYAALSASASDMLSLDASLEYSLDGEPLVTIDACWCGDIDDGNRQLSSLRRVAEPLLDAVGPMDYLTLQSRLQSSSDNATAHYQKSAFVHSLTPDAIHAICDAFRHLRAAHGTVGIQQLGGATSRIADDNNAFPSRGAQYWLTVGVSGHRTQVQRESDAVRNVWPAMAHHAPDIYLNAFMDETSERIRGSYGSHLARLTQIKRRYDPNNLFRLNANISLD